MKSTALADAPDAKRARPEPIADAERASFVAKCRTTPIGPWAADLIKRGVLELGFSDEERQTIAQRLLTLAGIHADELEFAERGSVFALQPLFKGLHSWAAAIPAPLKDAAKAKLYRRINVAIDGAQGREWAFCKPWRKPGDEMEDIDAFYAYMKADVRVGFVVQNQKAPGEFWDGALSVRFPTYTRRVVVMDFRGDMPRCLDGIEDVFVQTVSAPHAVKKPLKNGARYWWNMVAKMFVAV